MTQDQHKPPVRLVKLAGGTDYIVRLHIPPGARLVPASSGVPQHIIFKSRVSGGDVLFMVNGLGIPEIKKAREFKIIVAYVTIFLRTEGTSQCLCVVATRLHSSSKVNSQLRMHPYARKFATRPGETVLGREIPGSSGLLELSCDRKMVRRLFPEDVPMQT